MLLIIEYISFLPTLWETHRFGDLQGNQEDENSTFVSVCDFTREDMRKHRLKKLQVKRGMQQVVQMLKDRDTELVANGQHEEAFQVKSKINRMVAQLQSRKKRRFAPSTVKFAYNVERSELSLTYNYEERTEGGDLVVE